MVSGAIVGKFNGKVPTSFLFTEDNYSDFRLTLSSRMVTSKNHAGICFWGEIATQPDNKWYTHGPLVIFPNPSIWDYNVGQGLRVYKTTTEQVTSQYDWVKVEILAEGNRVRTAFNGVQVMAAERHTTSGLARAWPGTGSKRTRPLQYSCVPISVRCARIALHRRESRG